MYPCCVQVLVCRLSSSIASCDMLGGLSSSLCWSSRGGRRGRGGGGGRGGESGDEWEGEEG